MEFIEFRQRGWKVYKVLKITESTIEITNQDSSSETVSITDPRLSHFRTNTETLEGSEDLLNNLNFMDFSQITTELDLYLFSNEEERFLNKISGVIFFAFNQMMTLNYSEYPEWKPSFLDVCKKIVFAAVKLITNQDYKFGEKFQNKENFCVIGWQELGKIIEWIFKGADNFDAPGLDMLKDEGFFRSLYITNIQEFLEKFFRRACLRMFYLFNSFFKHFLIQPNSEFLKEFIKFCNGLSLKESRSFDIEQTEKLLQGLIKENRLKSAMVDICSSFFLKSEQIVQKLEIAKFLSLAGELKLPQNTCEKYLIVIFSHESLLDASKNILEHFLKNNGITSEVLSKIFESITFDVVINSYFRTFYHLINFMSENVVMTYLKQMICSNFPDKKLYLKEACKLIITKKEQRNYIKTLIKDDMLLLEVLPFDKSLDVELEIFEKYKNSFEQNEKLIDFFYKILENREFEALKIIEKRLKISYITLNQLKFDHNQQTLQKITKILEFLFSQSLADFNIIENILYDMKSLTNLQDLLCNWIENNILNAYDERLAYYFTSDENCSQIPKAFLIFLQKQNQIQRFNKKILYFSNRNFVLFDQLIYTYLRLNDEQLICDYLEFITRFLNYSTENLDYLKIKTYFNEGKSFHSNKTQFDRLMIELAGINTRVPFRGNKREYKIRTQNNIITIESPYEYKTDDFYIDICEKLNINPQNLIEGRTENNELVLSFDNQSRILYKINKIYLKSELWQTIDQKYYKFIPDLIEGLDLNTEKNEENSFLSFLYSIKSLNHNYILKSKEIIKKEYEHYKHIPIINQKILIFFIKIPDIQSDHQLNSIAYDCFLKISTSSEEDLDPNLICNYNDYDIRLNDSSKFERYIESFLNFKEKSFFTLESFIKPYLIYNTNINFNQIDESIILFPRGTLDPIVKKYLFHLLESKNYIYISTVLNSILLSKNLSVSFFNEIKKKIENSSEFSNINLFNYLLALKNLECCDVQIDLYSLNDWMFNQSKIKFKHEETRRLGYEILVSRIKTFSVSYNEQDYNSNQIIFKILNNIYDFSTRIDLKQIDKYQKYSKGFQIGLKGLKNFGNTCYINSSLQFLNAIRPLSQKLIFLRSNNESLNTLSYILAKLTYSNLSTVSSKRIIQKFIYKEGNLSFFVQDDASEFLSSLITRVDMLEAPYLLEDIMIEFSLSVYCNSCSKTSTSSGQTFMINMDLDGVDTIRNYFQTDGNLIKADKNICTQCLSINTQSTKYLITSPEYFIISFNRFKIDPNNQTTVKLNDFCDIKECFESNSKIYELIGFIVHFGNSNAGHYVTYLKQSQFWVLLDDHKLSYFPIETFDLNQLFNPNMNLNSNKSLGTPYILLYKMRKTEHEIFNKSCVQLIPEIFSKNKKIFDSFIFFSQDCNFLINKLIEYKLYPKVFLHFLLRVGVFLDLSQNEILKYSQIFMKSFNFQPENKKSNENSSTSFEIVLVTELSEYINLNIEEFISRLEFVKSSNLIEIIPKFFSEFLLYKTENGFQSGIIIRIIKYICSFDYRYHDFTITIELLTFYLKIRTQTSETTQYIQNILKYFMHYKTENNEYPVKLHPKKNIFSTNFISFFRYLSEIKEIEFLSEFFNNQSCEIHQAINSNSQSENLQYFKRIIIEKLNISKSSSTSLNNTGRHISRPSQVRNQSNISIGKNRNRYNQDMNSQNSLKKRDNSAGLN